MAATMKKSLMSTIDRKTSNAKCLFSVEELIDKAMGPPDQNTIHYKLLQKILHILSHHMRILKKKVYIGPDYVEKISESQLESKIDLSDETVQKIKGSGTEADKWGKAEQKTDKVEKTLVKRPKTAKKREKVGKSVSELEKIDQEPDSLEPSTEESAETEIIEFEPKNNAQQSKQTDLYTDEVDEVHAKEKSKKVTEKTASQHGKEATPRKKSDSHARSSILIKETELENEKILVVEKGPSKYGTGVTGSLQRVGSIQVVTQSQFNILEGVVNDLKKKVATIQMPKIPKDKQLKDEILQGKTSVRDIMRTMQVTARVQAAEQAIVNMADVLTKMAGKGMVPADVAEKLADVTAEMTTTVEELMAKSTAALQKAGIIELNKPANFTSKSSYTRYSTTAQAPYSTISTFSSMSKGLASVPMKGTQSVADGHFVTQDDLDDAITSLRTVLIKFIANQSKKITDACEKAAEIAKTVDEQMSIALTLNLRIAKLKSMVGDYNTQFKGFDSGLTSQMSNFNEQIELLRVDLKSGLYQMEVATCHTQKLIMQELNERYDDLVAWLKRLQFCQKETYRYNNELKEDIQGLADYAELLHEQKADREELKDALKDKANSTCLKGLMTEQRFQKEQIALMRSIAACHDKFDRQEEIWLDAIRDLAEITSRKAETTALLNAQHQTEKQLEEVYKLVAKVAIKLGDPQTAILTRKVSKNGVCGPCRTPALQQPEDNGKHVPPRLPAARPAPLGEDQPCTPKLDVKGFLPKLIKEDSPKSHVCNRWVGGSHTAVRGAARRVRQGAGGTPRFAYSGPPVRRYVDLGTDGKPYQVQDELVPCVECHAHVCRPDSSQLPEQKATKLSISKDKPSIDGTHTVRPGPEDKLSMDKVEIKHETSHDIVPLVIRKDEIENQSIMAVRSFMFHDEEGALDVEGKIE